MDAIEEPTPPARPAEAAAPDRTSSATRTRGDDLTRLLDRWQRGDDGADSGLAVQVHDELRRIAGRHLGRERGDHTLEATALAHEAWMRLARHRPPELEDREHFFAVASRVMRQVLVDHADRRRSLKRGGDRARVPLDDVVRIWESRVGDLLALHEALDRLAAQHPRQARVVEMRFFGGLTVEEVAEALDVSRATAERDWTIARARLHRELSP